MSCNLYRANPTNPYVQSKMHPKGPFSWNQTAWILKSIAADVSINKKSRRGEPDLEAMWGLGEKTARAAEYDCADRIWCSRSCSTSFARVIISCPRSWSSRLSTLAIVCPGAKIFWNWRNEGRIGDKERGERGGRKPKRMGEQGLVSCVLLLAGSAVGSWMDVQD